MGYGEFERCPLLWAMLPEREARVGCSDYWPGDGAGWTGEERKHNWGVKQEVDGGPV